MNKKAIHSDSAPAAIGTYSQAIQAGGLVFLSGQIPLVPETMEVVDGDFESRAREVFEKLRAVAEAAGGRSPSITCGMIGSLDHKHEQRTSSCDTSS